MKRSESPQVALYPPSQDHNDEDDPLDFLPPLPYHLPPPPRASPSHPSSKLKQISSSSGSSNNKEKKNKKSAQSIQTPSASPRHLPNRETTADSKTELPPTTKRRRTASTLVFRNDIDTEEMTPRKERILRRKQKLDQSEMTVAQPKATEVTTSSRQGTSTERQRARREEERRRSENEEREREIRKESERLVEAAEEEQDEEDYVKDEEISEDDEEEVVFVKDEDEGEGEQRMGERREIMEEPLPDTIAEWPARNDEVIRKRHHQAHDPNHSGRQQDPSTENHSSNREIRGTHARHSPSPSASSPPRSHSIPTLSAFIHSLDLPRLSRLIETFHELGISTREDVLALASTTIAGQRRREEIWKLVGEVERERGREFTKFEMATLKVGLEESRSTWGV
ncbi:hypothetical protein JCM5350_004452 [Sporobolomyces pararoseus]